MKAYIGKELSGEMFNKISIGINFVKLTNEMECHNNFQFEDGLNIDTIDFDPSGECKAGGIYFIDKTNAYLWTYYGIVSGMMKYMRDVIIPNDARIYIEENKFKADKIILKPRQNICKDIYVAASLHYLSLDYLPNDMRDKDICFKIAQWRPFEIKNIPPDILNKEICVNAVNHFSDALAYIPEKFIDRDMCVTAVNMYGPILQYVPESIIDKDICMLAIKRTSTALKYVPKYLIDKDLRSFVAQKYGCTLSCQI